MKKWVIALILVLAFLYLTDTKILNMKTFKKISEPTDAMIKHLMKSEGFERKAYKDTAGKWTIGIGHLIKQGEEYLLNKTLTDAEIFSLFRQDIKDTLTYMKRVFPNGLREDIFFPVFSIVYQTGSAGENLKRFALSEDISNFFKTFFLYTNQRVNNVLRSVYGIRKRRYNEYLFSKSVNPSLPSLNVSEYLNNNKIIIS